MNPLLLKYGLPAILLFLLGLMIWNWYDDNIEEAEERGATTQVEATNDATNQTLKEAEDVSKNIKDALINKPLDYIHGMLDSFETYFSGEDSSTPSVSTGMGTNTDDESGRGESEADNESSIPTGSGEQRATEKGMGEEVSEDCPPIIEFVPELNMNVLLPCEK